MNLLELPLIADPNQEFNCLLDEQECTIQLRLIGERFYFSLWVDDTAVVQNVIILPERQILLNVPTYKFKGNFWLVDYTSPFEEQSLPTYDELGSRFKLFYLSQDDIDEMLAE